MIFSGHVLHSCEPVFVLLLRHVVCRFACVGVSLEYLGLLVFFSWNVSDLPRFRLGVLFVELLELPVVRLLSFLWMVIVSFLLELLLRLVLVILTTSVLPLSVVLSALVLWVSLARTIVVVLVLAGLSFVFVCFLVSIVSLTSSLWGSLRVIALIIVVSLPTSEASVFACPYLVIALFFLLLCGLFVDDLSQVFLRVVNYLSLLGFRLFAIIFKSWLFRPEVDTQFHGVFSSDVGIVLSLPLIGFPLSPLTAVSFILCPSFLLSLSSEFFSLVIQFGLNITVPDKHFLRFLEVYQDVLGNSKVIVEWDFRMVLVLYVALMALGEVVVAGDCLLLVFNRKQQPNLVIVTLFILHERVVDVRRAHFLKAVHHFGCQITLQLPVALILSIQRIQEQVNFELVRGWLASDDDVVKLRVIHVVKPVVGVHVDLLPFPLLKALMVLPRSIAVIPLSGFEVAVEFAVVAFVFRSL